MYAAPASCIISHRLSSIWEHLERSLGENLIASTFDRGNFFAFSSDFMLSFGRIYSLLFQLPRTDQDGTIDVMALMILSGRESPSHRTSARKRRNLLDQPAFGLSRKMARLALVSGQVRSRTKITWRPDPYFSKVSVNLS